MSSWPGQQGVCKAVLVRRAGSPRAGPAEDGSGDPMQAVCKAVLVRRAGSPRAGPAEDGSGDPMQAERS
jgi:hypothetical protein